MRTALAAGLGLALLLALPGEGITADPDAAAPAATGTAAAATPMAITEKSFRCLTDMTPVRGFFVDNLLPGQLEATLAVAHSPTGGIYPPGSVVQLFPNEVMVKRETGFNPITRDWEFFELDVSKNGSTIRTRGFAEVKNRFDGNCFACHIQAKPEWDLICEDDHGCEKLPIKDFAIHAMQNTDPRCDTSDTPLHQRFTAWLIRALTPL